MTLTKKDLQQIVEALDPKFKMIDKRFEQIDERFVLMSLEVGNMIDQLAGDAAVF